MDPRPDFLTTPNTLSLRSRMSYLLRGYPNQFHLMIEVDPPTQRERPLAHINPIGYLELHDILSRWGFKVDVVRTSRYLKRCSPFYALLRVLLNSKGKLEARSIRKLPRSDRRYFPIQYCMGTTTGGLVGSRRFVKAFPFSLGSLRVELLSNLVYGQPSSGDSV